MTTETLVRPPLESLTMSAAQSKTRRTSARLDTADDDGPPAKRAKTDGARAPAARTANGKKAVPADEQQKNYDRSEGGFMFKKKTKKTAAAAQPAEAPRPQQSQPEEPLRPQPSRGRKRASGSLDGASKTPRAPAEPQRRSKRLSAEKATDPLQATQPAIAAVAAEAPKQAETAKPRGRKQNKDHDGIHVEKKRGPTKIALPFADTPVIQRNKQMRQVSSESRRRSSSTMRGRRASVLIEAGTSNALPHDNIEVGDFYKHISMDLPEPRRMKQLMTWCGARALAERPGADSADANATLAARAIQDELLQDFANKPEMSDWSNRPEDVRPIVLVKKPNPRNEQNAAKLKELEAEVQRLESEKASWDSLLGSLSNSLDESVKATSEESSSAPIDVADLSDAEQAECLKLLSSQASLPGKTGARLKEATGSLEFKIDSFSAGVHKVEQLGRAVDGTVDRVLEQANAALEERNRKHGGETRSVGDLLRAFSRAASS